jgi:CRP-like cAMP-binding protein
MRRSGKASPVEQALQGFQGFDELDPEDIRLLAGAGKERTVEQGRELLREGESGVGFHVILEGEAVVTRGGEEVSRLGQGAFFGEIALIGEQARAASVTAATPIRLLSIPSGAFLQALDRSPRFGKMLLREWARRMRT